MLDSPVYLQMSPNSALPEIAMLAPFRAVVVVEAQVSSDWQALVSDWLVRSGCLYMMAWGEGCSSWDDSVDIANLNLFDYAEIPDAKFVMTTWHPDEPMTEAFWFSKHNAFHDSVEITNTLLVHISTSNKERDMLQSYAQA